MNGKKCIDADALELAYRRMNDIEKLGQHSGGYVYNRLFETLLTAPAAFPAGWPCWRSPDDPPTKEDTDPSGYVLAIHKAEGRIDRWWYGTVICNPENFYYWHPLPKMPDLKKFEGVQNGVPE